MSGQRLLKKGTDPEIPTIHLKEEASGSEQRRSTAQGRSTGFERERGVIYFKQHFEIAAMIPLSSKACAVKHLWNSDAALGTSDFHFLPMFLTEPDA